MKEDLFVDIAIVLGLAILLGILVAMLLGVTTEDSKWLKFKREHNCYTLDETRAKCADGKIYWRPE